MQKNGSNFQKTGGYFTDGTNVTAVILCLLMAVFSLCICAFSRERVSAQTWDGTTVAEAFSVGEGTQGSPYEISGGEELALLAKLINEDEESSIYNFPEVYYALKSDIYLNDTQDGWGTNPNEWVPIGSGGAQFNANFDGGDFSVKGVYIDKTVSNSTDVNYGLFGSVGGKIKNVGVDGKISVRGTGVSAGGIAGYLAPGGAITNCRNNAEITANNNAGGIAGGTTGGSITNCYNEGQVTSEEAASYAGGIIGFSQSAQIINSFNKGVIKGGGAVGGILGHATDSVITNCFNDGSLLGTESGSDVGGIAGFFSDEGNTVSYCYYLDTTALGAIGSGTVGGTVLAFSAGGSLIDGSLALSGCTVTTVLDALNLYIINGENDELLFFDPQESGIGGFTDKTWHIVSFDSNGGTGGTVPSAPILLRAGDKPSGNNPTHADPSYVFLGWCTDSAGNNKWESYNGGADTVTLYAKYGQKSYEYIITNAATGSNYDIAGKVSNDDGTYSVGSVSASYITSTIQTDAGTNNVSVQFGTGSDNALNVSALTNGLNLNFTNRTVTISGDITSASNRTLQINCEAYSRANISNSGSGYSVIVQSDKTLTVTGGLISSGINNNYGVVLVSGGVITASNGSGTACGIVNEGGTVTVTGGEVSGDFAINSEHGVIELGGNPVCGEIVFAAGYFTVLASFNPSAGRSYTLTAAAPPTPTHGALAATGGADYVSFFTLTNENFRLGNSSGNLIFIRQYNVTFAPNNSDNNVVTKVDMDTAAAEPSAPSHIGYVFFGWYKDNGTFVNKFDFTTPITADLTLYARWLPKAYEYVIKNNAINYDAYGKIDSLAETYALKTNSSLAEAVAAVVADIEDTSTPVIIRFGEEDGRLSIGSSSVTLTGLDASLYGRLTSSNSSQGGGALILTGGSYSLFADIINSSGDYAVRCGQNTSLCLGNAEIEGIITVYPAKLSLAAGGADGFAPEEDAEYRIEFISPAHGNVGVAGGGAYIENFTVLNIRFDFAESGGNLVLSAQYLVTFNMSYTAAAPSEQTINHGNKAIAVTDPVRAGCVFDGWWKKSGDAFSEKWNFESSTVTEDITLYARWKAEITLDARNGSQTTKQTLDFGDKITAPSSDPVREGYTFGGWWISSDGGSSLSARWNFEVNVVSGALTLYARWTASPVKIEGDFSGGTYGEDYSETVSASCETGGNFSFAVTSGTLPAGLSLNSVTGVVSGTPTAAGTFNFIITAANTLSGAVDAKQFSVIIAKTDAPSAPDLQFDNITKSTVTIKAVNGAEYSKNGIDWQNGVFFEGLSVNTEYTFYIRYKETANFFTSAAETRKVTTQNYINYTLTFNSDGGSEVASQTAREDMLFTRPADPVRAGYLFMGWGKTQSQEYSAGLLYDWNSPASANITLYAMWKHEDSSVVTIVYIVEGTTYLTQSIAAGAAPKKPADPSVSGKIFAGWYLDAAFTRSFNFANATAEESIKLYAKFTDSLYSISGHITDSEGRYGAFVSVSVRNGNILVAHTVADGKGEFTLENIPAGYYNIAITSGKGAVKTDTIHISGNISNFVSVISAYNIGSQLVVDNSARDVIADGLNGLFSVADQSAAQSGEAVKYRIDIFERKASESIDVRQQIGSNLSGKLVIGALFELKAFKGAGLQKVSTFISLIELYIPLAAEETGRENYVIYLADGETRMITQIPNANGEYFVISEDGKSLTVFVKTAGHIAICFDGDEKASNLLWVLIAAGGALVVAFVGISILKSKKAKKSKNINFRR